MTSLLTLCALSTLQSTPVKPLPADPLLSKMSNAGMLAYVRRLEPQRQVLAAMMGDQTFLIAEIPKHGGKIVTRTKSVMTALMPVGQLLELANTPQLKLIEMGWLHDSGLRKPETTIAEKLAVFPKSSVPLSSRPYAVQSWPLADIRRQGLTGKGVLVGMIEFEVPDFRHPDLQSSAGQSRFELIWNQEGTSGAKPEQYGYGEEFTREEQNRMLRGGTYAGLKFGDGSDHVTSSTGGAAGNGAAMGKYCGVAPEANLASVSAYLSSTNVVDAARYLFDLADRLKQPCVINISGSIYGVEGDLNDGSSPASIALSEMVAEKPGRAIVSSAGNNAGWKAHFHARLQSDASPIRYALAVGSIQPRYIHQIRTSKDASLDIKLELISANSSDSAAQAESEWISLNQMKPGEPLSISLMNGEFGYTVLAVPRWHPRGLPAFRLEISPIKARNCALRLSYRGSGEFDAQINTLMDALAKPKDDASYLEPDSEQRVSAPADGERVFACGAYIDAESWTTMDGKTHRDGVRGEPASYSEKGGLYFGKYKPIVLAPTGYPAPIAIDSPETADLSKILGPAHQRYTGTSASGPALAGAIALYFQTHPKASYSQVEEALCKAAYADKFTGSVPNSKSGYGKLDLMKFLFGKSRK